MLVPASIAQAIERDRQRIFKCLEEWNGSEISFHQMRQIIVEALSTCETEICRNMNPDALMFNVLEIQHPVINA